ncbi:hypothetical protein Tco_1130102, partial [Tanacetum coccineum]
TADDLTLAQTLIEFRSAKSKVKGVVIGEQSESTTRTKPQQLPLKDKAQMQAELEEEDRHVRQREEEANIISWDNMQAMIDVDYQMAQQMQLEEQEKLSIEEKSKLFVQLLEEINKHFAAIRAKEKRNKPPTKAQKRNTMSTYLKTCSKRAGEVLEQESSKKQKLEEDKESEELKQCLEIVLDDGDRVTIDATPLSTKSSTIMYLTFGTVLKNFDKEDMEVLWSIVKERFKKTEPVNYIDNFLLLNLKTMFEHLVEDNMFKDVKFQVDYEYEMAFKLLRLVKKQLKEGYVPE